MPERYQAKLPGKHLFTKGTPKPANSGRKKGQQNRVTIVMREALALAADNVGRPKPVILKRKTKNARPVIIGHQPTGEDGLVGYLEWAALAEPVAFMGLLGKLMPLQVEATATVEHSIKSRFSDVDPTKMSLSELQSAMREAIGMTKPLAQVPKLIDVTPTR